MSRTIHEIRHSGFCALIDAATCSPCTMSRSADGLMMSISGMVWSCPDRVVSAAFPDNWRGWREGKLEHYFFDTVRAIYGRFALESAPVFCHPRGRPDVPVE